MLTADTIATSTARLDDILAKRSVVRESLADKSAYQNLTVLKRLSKAKFPVYLATSKVNHRNYAMKTFNFRGDKPHPYFRNEARFSCLKHPNVIETVYSEAEKETLYRGELMKVSYILMEFAPHGDFFDFITKYRDEVDEKLARTYFRQMIDGIEYLHSCSVAHLDLKPENILLGADFGLRIADFDLSHVEGDNRIMSRGTRYYRGPEFFKTASGEEPKLTNPYASDIYSAGVILFILKSGGIYPHSENTLLDGVDLADMMSSNNGAFWAKHCEIQERSSSFFDKDFKELYNVMTRANPADRASIKQIKESKWYNGAVYSPAELQKKMKKILDA